MEKRCLTGAAVKKEIRQWKRRNSGFFLLLFGFLCAAVVVIVPINEYIEAKQAGGFSPLTDLLRVENIPLLIAAVLAFVLLRAYFRGWTGEKNDRFELTFGSCVNKRFHDSEDSVSYHVTARLDRGVKHELEVPSGTYDSLGKEDPLYALTRNGDSIIAVWSAREYYLAKELYPMLSAGDLQREQGRRLESEREDPRDSEKKDELERRVHDSGELSEDDRRRLRRVRIFSILFHLVFFIVAYFLNDDEASTLLCALALVVVFGQFCTIDGSVASAFIARALRKARDEQEAYDPALLEQSVRRQVKRRRLRFALDIALLSLPCLGLCLVGMELGKNGFGLGCFAVALGFLILALRRAIGAFVKPREEWEEETLSRLLGK